MACALVACVLVACAGGMCVGGMCAGGMCVGNMCVNEQSVSVELCLSRCPVPFELRTHCVRQTILGLKWDFFRLL